MRFLHTADWHLGRAFHGESLLDAQAGAIEHVPRRPASYARRRDPRRRRPLRPCAAAGRRGAPGRRRAGGGSARSARWSSISGNHDSATRLGFGSGLLARAGVHVRTTRRDRAPGGARRRVRVRIPYLEPDVTRVALGCEERGARRGARRRDGARPRGPPRARRARIIVMAHAFVAGAIGCAASATSRSAARRPSGSTFAGVDYVALGHLHGPQRIGRARATRDRRCRSRSPRPAEKSCRVVELAARAARRAGPFPVAGRSRCCAGRWTSCSPTRRTPSTEGVGAGDGHRPGAAAGRDGARCGGGSRTPSASRSSPRAPAGRRRAVRAAPARAGRRRAGRALRRRRARRAAPRTSSRCCGTPWPGRVGELSS